jgi:hypothetical protein
MQCKNPLHVIECSIPSLTLGVLNSCAFSKDGNVPIALLRGEYLGFSDEIGLLNGQA